MKRYLGILLVGICLSSYSYSQEALQFGVNTNVEDKNFQEILNDTLNNYQNFFKNYNIKILRFPGGNAVRAYIWNNTSYSQVASEKYADYLNIRKEVQEGDNTVKTEYKPTILTRTYYNSFLNFCNKNNITPLIQVNTLFYAVNDNLYQIGNFKKRQVANVNTNWADILASLKSQVEYSHKVVDIIIWEIGNEDYFMYNPEKYGGIVIRFVNTIKSLYPEDKVCVSMAPSFWGMKNQINWNKTFVQYLASQNFLNKIDFFCPHFYNKPNQKINNYDDAVNKLESTNFEGFENDIVSYFPSDYTPRFFITEYSTLLKSYDNPAYNTQLHALMMFYYLFNFEGFSNLGGIINHGFNQRPAGIVFNEGFHNRNEILVSDTSYVFKYISPEAKAISLFFKYLGNHRGSLTSDGKLLIIKINAKNTIETLLLNYDKNDLQENIKSLLGERNNGNLKADYYSLDDLSSNYWNPVKKGIKDVASQNIILPGLSFIYLKMALSN